jgi:hypothetical protein
MEMKTELRNAELDDQQKILDLEADFEKDKILDGNSQDLYGIDPDDDDVERPSNASNPPARDGAENLQEDHFETWMKKNDDIDKTSKPDSMSHVVEPEKLVTPPLHYAAVAAVLYQMS